MSACPTSIWTPPACAFSAARPTIGRGAAGRWTSSTSRSGRGSPHSGWPLTRAELDPFYREAQKICQLGAFDYRPGPWLDPGQKALPFDPAKVLSRVWQYSPPTRFGEVYRGELEAAANVDVLLHATVVDIEANEAGSEVLRLAVRTLEGKRATVRARAYVLACGGLENPRLLLAANRQVKAGLGNQQGLVGRYFMEHPHCNAARALVVDPALLSFYTFGQGGGHAQGLQVVGCLNQSPERQRARELLNFDSLFTLDDVGNSGFAALRRIWTAAGHGPMAGASGRGPLAGADRHRRYRLGPRGPARPARVPPEPGRLSHVVHRRGGAQPGQPGAPRRPARCAGHARIVLDWRLTGQDKRSLLAGYQAVAEEFGRTGLGRLQIADWLTEGDDSWSPTVEGGHHHLGTTRMSRTRAGRGRPELAGARHRQSLHCRQLGFSDLRQRQPHAHDRRTGAPPRGASPGAPDHLAAIERAREDAPGSLRAVRRLVDGLLGRVVAALPDVPDEGGIAGDVALGVEADPAEHGIELVRAQRRRDLCGRESPGLLDRFGPT